MQGVGMGAWGWDAAGSTTLLTAWAAEAGENLLLSHQIHVP